MNGGVEQSADDNIIILADMPGVAEKDIDIMLEKDVLTINGYISSVTAPEGYELAHDEYGIGDYQRNFTLPDEVDRDNIEASLPDLPEPVVVNDNYPSDGHHGWKFIRFGPDGRLYVPVGAPCNVCETEGTPYGKITSITPDGSDLQVYAEGVRNSVGFDWHPETGALWFTDNGRDNLGRSAGAGVYFYRLEAGDFVETRRTVLLK